MVRTVRLEIRTWRKPVQLQSETISPLLTGQSETSPSLLIGQSEAELQQMDLPALVIGEVVTNYRQIKTLSLHTLHRTAAFS